MSSSENGWNEHSKLVLRELSRLNDSSTNLTEAVLKIREGQVKLLIKADQLHADIDSLKKWKSSLEEIASIGDIERLSTDVQALKQFRTVATTVWFVVQILIGVLITFKDYLI